MVTEYGMSSLGPVQYEQAGEQTFLGRDYMSEKRFSDQVALEIDQEVRKIINNCYEEGKRIINENRDLLNLIAEHLIQVETLTREDIEDLTKNGKLAWWEKKKAKMAEEERIRNEKIAEEEAANSNQTSSETSANDSNATNTTIEDHSLNEDHSLDSDNKDN